MILLCLIGVHYSANRIYEFPFSLMNELGFILEPSFFVRIIQNTNRIFQKYQLRELKRHTFFVAFTATTGSLLS